MFLLLVSYLGIVLLFAFLQRSLIYHPTVESSLPPSAAGLGERVEALRVKTAGHLVLNGWLTHPPPPEPGGIHPAEGWLLVYFPGNAGHRGNRVPRIDAFSRLGLDVVLVDYRGYGDNPGRPTEVDLHADARATWDHLLKTTGVPAGRMILHGESLGGAVAVRLAADLSREGTPPGGLLLKSTFSSMADAGQYHYPWLPVRTLLVDRFESIEHIGEVTCPIVMIHGDADHVVPPMLGERLAAAAPALSASGRPRQFLRVPGVGHNDVPQAELLRGTVILVRGVEKQE